MNWSDMFKNYILLQLVWIMLFWPKGFVYCPLPCWLPHYHTKPKGNTLSWLKQAHSFQGMTISVSWFHWISNFQLKSVPGQTSPEAPMGAHAVAPSVHLRYVCMHRQTHSPRFGPFFLHRIPFWCSEFRRLLKAIPLGTICPIYPAPSCLQRSFRQWV